MRRAGAEAAAGGDEPFERSSTVRTVAPSLDCIDTLSFANSRDADFLRHVAGNDKTAVLIDTRGRGGLCCGNAPQCPTPPSERRIGRKGCG